MLAVRMQRPQWLSNSDMMALLAQVSTEEPNHIFCTASCAQLVCCASSLPIPVTVRASIPLCRSLDVVNKSP
jgi:hypothetical protein